MIKACKSCSEKKPLEEFGRLDRARDGRRGTCRGCSNRARRERIAADPDKRRAETERVARWRNALPKDVIAEKRRLERRATAAKKGKAYLPLEDRIAVNAHKAMIARGARRQRLREESELRRVRRIAATVALKPWRSPRLSVAERFAMRYQLDPSFNMKERLRAAMRRKVRAGICERLRAALRRTRPHKNGIELFLGYSIEQLRCHIEKQFTKGMDWPTFMRGEIHLDHRVPLSFFDLSDLDDLKRAWQLPNLQPLWAPENRTKAGRRTLLV